MVSDTSYLYSQLVFYLGVKMNNRELARLHLYRLNNIDYRIKNQLEQVQKWRDIALNTTSHLNDIKVQTSHDQDKMGSAVTNVVHKEKQCYEMAKEYIELKDMILHQIEGMTNEKQYNVLYLFYVNHFNYEEIETELNYSHSQIRRIMREGLDAFGAKYHDEIVEYNNTHPFKIEKNEPF